MHDNPIYLPNGHEESPVSGWYYVTEAEELEGPYPTKILAEESLKWYIKYMINDKWRKG